MVSLCITQGARHVEDDRTSGESHRGVKGDVLEKEDSRSSPIFVISPSDTILIMNAELTRNVRIERSRPTARSGDPGADCDDGAEGNCSPLLSATDCCERSGSQPSRCPLPVLLVLGPQTLPQSGLFRPDLESVDDEDEGRCGKKGLSAAQHGVPGKKARDAEIHGVAGHSVRSRVDKRSGLQVDGIDRCSLPVELQD